MFPYTTDQLHGLLCLDFPILLSNYTDRFVWESRVPYTVLLSSYTDHFVQESRFPYTTVQLYGPLCLGLQIPLYYWPAARTTLSIFPYTTVQLLYTDQFVSIPLYLCSVIRTTLSRTLDYPTLLSSYTDHFVQITLHYWPVIRTTLHSLPSTSLLARYAGHLFLVSPILVPSQLYGLLYFDHIPTVTECTTVFGDLGNTTGGRGKAGVLFPHDTLLMLAITT